MKFGKRVYRLLVLQIFFIGVSIQGAERAQESVFKKNPIPFPGGPKSLQIAHEYNLSKNDLKDKELDRFIRELLMIRDYAGYIREIYESPNDPDYTIVKKYFVDSSKIVPKMLSPKDQLREDLKVRFGNDCPNRLESWEGYKDLVEKFNKRLKAKNIDIELSIDTIAHVCHAHLKDERLVGGHFHCKLCTQGFRNVAIGKGKQIKREIRKHELGSGRPVTYSKESTYFCLTTKVGEVLDKIAETFENNPFDIQKFKRERRIVIQAADGEYITILLKPDNKTIDTFFPSEENFDKK